MSPMASYERLGIEAVREGSRTLLRLRGELDLGNAPLLESELETADVQRVSALLVDLQELQFMDSTGLRLLLTTDKRLRERGVEFSVTGVSGQVERLFNVSQAGKHLNMFEPPDATD
jgi:anti-sigma B factor antagonist